MGPKTPKFPQIFRHEHFSTVGTPAKAVFSLLYIPRYLPVPSPPISPNMSHPHSELLLVYCVPALTWQLVRNSNGTSPKTIYDTWAQGDGMPNMAENVPRSTGARLSSVKPSVQPSDPNRMQNYLNNSDAWSSLNRTNRQSADHGLKTATTRN